MDLGQALDRLDQLMTEDAMSGRQAEVSLRSRRTLDLILGTSERDCVESVGLSQRVTARVWDSDREGFAEGAFVEGDDLAAWLARAAAGWATGSRVSLPSMHKAPETAPMELSSSRARQIGERVSRALAAVPGSTQTVLVTLRSEGVAIANSAGLRVAEWRPNERALLRHETAAGALVDGIEGPALDPTSDPRRLVDRVSDAAFTIAADGGAPEAALPWMVRPPVAAPWLTSLGVLLRADATEAGGLARALGKKLFPACLSVTDDPSHGPRRLSFDDEGRACGVVGLVAGGVLTDLLHSSQTAQRLRALPNGRAFSEGLDHRLVPAPINLRIETSAQPSALDFNELCARFEVFNTRPKPGRVSCIVAGWVVRAGARLRRIAPFELELPVLETFRQLSWVGSDLSFFPAHGGCGTPSLLFSSLPQVPTR